MRAALLALLLAAPAAAHAYPQFQLSTGAVRCNQCHYAPSGGGLLNPYGRDEAGDAISAGGDGRFLHGLWEPPSWLGLGADLRFAGLATNEGAVTGVDWEAFPMLADLYARAAVGGFSVYVNLGYRGSARPTEPPVVSRILSREHYVMWREGATGWYVRAGRFFAPYGIRLPEHTAYIRRFLGFNTLEETYDVSGGYIDDDLELHLTAFTPDFIRGAVGDRGSGGAAYFEQRVLEHKAAWGAQARVSVGDTNTRSSLGLVGKLYLDGPRIQLLAEVDVVLQSLRDLGPDRWQLFGYLGAAWFPLRGLLFQLQLERFDEDMAVKGVARDAVSVELQWFPTAHVEVSLYGRLQIIGTGTADGPLSEVGLLQFHYYL
jgi:hypothetical protein